MKAAFSSTSREFTSRYAGLSFYWAWVFLSFNSLDIVGGDGRAISIVHIMSSATAMVMFAVCALSWRSVMGWAAKRRSNRAAGMRRDGACRNLPVRTPLVLRFACGDGRRRVCHGIRLHAYRLGLGCNLS